MTCPHTRWIVNRQGIETRLLFLSCEKCKAKGYVEPTAEEWEKAIYAPEHPYTWEGGNERVRGIYPEMLPRFEEAQ